MHLQKLFETQRALEAQINVQHPPANGHDRLDENILALQSELGELSNEWRGFKYWSYNRNPRIKTAVKVSCEFCSGQGYFLEEACRKCSGTGEVISSYRNPLLEEYVDCLHYLLIIGLTINIQERYADEVNFNIGARTKKSVALKVFKNCYRKIAIFDLYRSQRIFMDLFSEFTTLGDALGFTEEQIEEAYYAKNDVNYKRLESGY